LAVLGSATPPGRLRRATAEAIARAAEHEHLDGHLIDLAEVDVAAVDGRTAQEIGGDTAAVVQAIAAAGAVLLATPVYRGSMSGSLKNLLDHVPVEALEGKPVAILSMGATQHHFLGAERHLRDVLAFFGALVCPIAVYLTSASFHEGAPGAAAAQLDELLAELIALTTAAAAARAVGPRPLFALRP
jgi:FMN reductase